MKDRIARSDNFGRTVPPKYGTGLVAYIQPREFGADLLKVRDPQVKSAWIVSDTVMEVGE